MHKFTRVLFAVELAGTAYGVDVPAAQLEKLLAYAATLCPGGSLSMYPMPNQNMFETIFVKCTLPETELASFESGVVYSAARIIEMHDQPTIAKDLLDQAGLDSAKLVLADEYDLGFIRQIDEYADLPTGKD